MLDQFTITKAIHNFTSTPKGKNYGWNARSIYNYESHSQLRGLKALFRRWLECSINLQLRKPFTTWNYRNANPGVVGMLDQFTITKAIHNYVTNFDDALQGWNARSIYNYESHSQLTGGSMDSGVWLECSINLQLRKPFTTVSYIS